MKTIDDLDTSGLAALAREDGAAAA